MFNPPDEPVYVPTAVSPTASEDDTSHHPTTDELTDADAANQANIGDFRE